MSGKSPDHSYDLFVSYGHDDEQFVQELLKRLQGITPPVNIVVGHGDEHVVIPADQHIVSTSGVAGGKPRINGHRITVQNIAIWHERMGMSADEIATEYNLTLGQVYAALAYYHDHREEIEGSIRADATFVEEMKQRYPSELAERLLTR